jgi:DNA-binding CsgD family transcriptional regulator
VALNYRAAALLQSGRFAEAAALIEEADAISDASGHQAVMLASFELTAWRGREAETLRMIDRMTRVARTVRFGRPISLGHYSKAILYNGLGRYPEALTAAQQACEHEDLDLYGRSLVELVEAGVRSGKVDLASDALERLVERTALAGTDWARGIEARSRALLTDGPAAEALYVEAIDRLTRTRIRAELARGHLLYGEWLRREGRRTDAREQLRPAHEMLTGMGAEAFGERARRELMATGETVRKRRVDTRNELTAQEAQIARLAADGHTNPEIGAQLFVSPRTVEWHLRKVYTKLDISSRRELRRALAGMPGGHATS